MSRLYALLFLLAASSQASDILRRRPDPKSAPVTIARREAVASPIVTVPTIILGPSSEYMQTPVRISLELCEISTIQFQPTDSLQKSTATVTGSAVTIVEADQKTDGVDIYFGPDAWKSIEAAGKKNCNTPTSPICVPGLQSAISPPGLRLQARGAVFLVVAAIVALVAVVIEQYHLYNTEQPHIHVPYHALTQISSAQGSSTVAYATATDDPSVIIVTSTATQEPLPR